MTSTPVTDALGSQGAIQPGTQGWWRVWGATVNDIQAGDLIMVGTKADDGSHVITEHHVVTIVPEDGIKGAIYLHITNDGGERWIGRMCPVQVLRQGTHNTLAGSVR